jgi:RimJ/RimL family protein N-acetyltransferase
VKRWDEIFKRRGSKELRHKDRITEFAALVREPRAWVEKKFPYFITAKNVIASVVLVRPLRHNVWKVGWIYTRPEFRNRGLATRVLRSAVARTRAEGATHIVARVYKSNSASRRVFRKAGFRVWASTPRLLKFEKRSK